MQAECDRLQALGVRFKKLPHEGVSRPLPLMSSPRPSADARYIIDAQRMRHIAFYYSEPGELPLFLMPKTQSDISADSYWIEVVPKRMP